MNAPRGRQIPVPQPRVRAPRLAGLISDLDRALPRGRIPTEGVLDGDRWVVRAQLPGLEPSDAVDLSVGDGVLQLDVGRRGTGPTGGLHRLHEVLSVPDGTRPEDVTSSYADGVLTLSMPAVGRRAGARSAGAPAPPVRAALPGPAGGPAPRTDGAVVVGVDGSRASMAALRWALPMVRQEGCPLEIVAAWTNPTREARHQVPGHVNEERERAARAAGAAAVLAARALGTDVPVTTLTVRGEPADVLAERARGARFLVLGSPRDLEAGVPGACQHRVHCPVFIVVPPDQA